MAKLTKGEIKSHAEAMELILSGRELDFEDRMTVIEGFHEGATHSNASASAFFTPWDLAMSVPIETGYGRILDLCAGIGTLSLAIDTYHAANGESEFTLVEANPDYCAVARRLMPHARVICGSVFDPAVIREIGTGYDCVVSNPPFGKTIRHGNVTGRYVGAEAEYAVIDVASDLADRGVFILPQQSVSFRMSADVAVYGDRCQESTKYGSFRKQTGITLDPNMGIDCRFACDLWRGTKVVTEIAICDFVEVQEARRAAEQARDAAEIEETRDLFSMAA